MSKVRNLPEITSLDNDDLLYTVDSSAGPNGGRKITKANLKETIKQSAAEIKTAYESNPDTNAFTDAEQTKLAGIEAGATADQNASEVPYSNIVSGLSATQVQAAIDEVSLSTQADFRPSIVSGRILHYTGGTVRFDGIFYELVANDILLSPNITNGEVYVDLDGLVKQTGSGVLAPPYTVVFAKFSTDLNDIVSLTDERVKNSQNIIRGTLSDVRDVRAGAAAAEGTSGRISDAMHKHNILTGAPSTQTPDQANSEGASANLARADHIHAIATAVPSAIGIANSQGASSAFSRADHIHDHGSQPGGNLHSVATTSVAGFMSATDKLTVDLLKEIQSITNEPTGFPNRTDSVISFDEPTRMFTIQPTGVNFDYWIAGEKFTVSSPQNIQIGTNTGLHFIWFDDNGALQTSFGPPFSDVFIEPIAFVSVLYWNNTSQKIITLGDERHGMTMDNASHRLVNNAFGAIFNSGLAIDNFTIDGDGSSNTHAQFNVENGSFFDEDILFNIVDDAPQPLSPIAQLPILYRLGSSGDWYKKAADNFPLIYSGSAGYTGASGRMAFNEFNGAVWQLTEVNEDSYVWIHVIVVNDTSAHVLGIQGINQYATPEIARNGVEAEIAQLGTLAAREQLVIGSVLFKSSSLYANTPKVVTSSVLGSNYVDFRQVLVQVSGASNDHSSLANLQSDTHVQYLNRSGVRPMEGDLDLGGNDINNVGSVDGVDISAHASRHLPSGADPIATASAVGLTANSTNTEGAANSLARSDHTHDLSTGVVSSQAPDQANAEGTSVNLARADHIHNIPAAAPITNLSPATANSEGAGSSFARNDHTHALDMAQTGNLSTVNAGDVEILGSIDRLARADHQHPVATAVASSLDANSTNTEGVSVNLARADHTHDLSTGSASGLDANSTNTEGVSANLARSDHTHDLSTGAPSAQNPDQANAEGVSANLARADHIHNIPTDAPITALSPATTNAEGVGTSFARNDHTHAVATAAVGNITTIQPDDAASAGTSDTFARGDHRHAIVAAAPVNTGTANSEGVSTSFARADHVHDTTIANSVASATADDTTASTTDVLIVGMTLTPASGTYLAIFSSSVLNSGNGASRLFVNLYSGGSLITHSEREIGIAGGANVPVHTSAIIAVNGSQAIEARWRAVAGTNTCHERSLTLIRLGA